ncbi:unnamed protein product [Larinioides sclopetarius]|uniref:Uncharacterized protein n=1 Tax=Larinioides sclopetarius TaxID=280406 RepID=A0AAV2BRB0_9ARAC
MFCTIYFMAKLNILQYILKLFIHIQFLIFAYWSFTHLVFLICLHNLTFFLIRHLGNKILTLGG